MRSLFRSILVFCAILGFAAPSLGWEYGTTDLGEGQIIHHVATVDGAETASIIFGCNNLVPGQVQFQIVTSQQGATDRSASAEILIDGRLLRLDGTLGDAEGL